jgi:hypothetical protein
MDRPHAKETKGRYREVGTGLRSARSEKMKTPKEDLERRLQKGKPIKVEKSGVK